MLALAMWNTYVTTNTRNTQKKIHNRTYFNKEKLDFLDKYTKKLFSGFENTC